MPPRPDFVDQAHQEPWTPPAVRYEGIVHEWKPDKLERPRPSRWEKLDELAALVIAFIAASFVLAHLLVAAGVGMAGCAGG